MSNSIFVKMSMNACVIIQHISRLLLKRLDKLPERAVVSSFHFRGEATAGELVHF